MTRDRQEEPRLSEDVPRNQGWSSVGDVLGGLKSQVEPKGASLSQRAYDAWMQANGDVERRHTVGTYLRQEDGELPTLVIYIDSRAMMQDFMTNHLLYLDRLAMFGMRLKAVEFRLSKYRRETAATPEPEEQPEAEELPPATPQEIAMAREMTQDLPPALREAASEAVISSIRRSHVENTSE